VIERLRTRPAILVVVPAVALALAFGSATPAFASGSTPTPQTLAAMKAEADAVQAKLTTGARALEAARSRLTGLTATAATAKAAAAAVNAELAVLRDRLSSYAAELYVHPAAQDAVAALTAGPDLETSMQGVEMLSILNRGRGDVLNAVIVDEQRAEVLQTQSAQAVAAAAHVQTSITAQVATLQAESAAAATQLTAAQAAYQAELARAEAAQLAQAAKAALDQKVAHDAAAARVQAALAQAARDQAASDAALARGSAAACGAATGRYPTGPWGGYSDGLIPSSQLCAIIGGGSLRPDAAAAFNAMSKAYAQAFGTNLCVSDSYRSYSQQVSVFRKRPSLAAVPGTSNHGWGLAVDLGCGVQSSRSAGYRWMTRNASRFGWVHPAWALHDPYEPWHWEFGHLSGAGGT
jgi:peptidoglycan DL-endopeptidase CwlO